MEKVPQIVSERLRAASGAANHPDADLLTAFSEHALSGPERTLVMQHLASCSECREIVALALPASQSLQQVVRPSKSAWITWPVLRWGVVAAGVVLVGSFGFLEYQHRHESRANLAYTSSNSLDKEAKNAAPPLPSQMADEAKAKDTSPQRNRPEPDGAAAGVPKSEAPTPSAPALVRVNPPATNLQHGPHVQFQQNATFQQNQAGDLTRPAAPARVLASQPGVNQPAPAQSEAGNFASAPPVPQNETANLDVKVAPLSSQSGAEQLESRVERSKPATPSIAPKAQAVVSEAPNAGSVTNGNTARLVAASPAATVVWSVTSSGTLRRSFDQGNTWQYVDLRGRNDALRQSFHGTAKQAATDALKKDTQGPVFRAVASNGPDVWAGASGGLLYHSTDAGEHWLRVVPYSSDASLTGDILSLEFPDPQHGRVVTAVPEVWTTADGGHTWQKQ